MVKTTSMLCKTAFLFVMGLVWIQGEEIPISSSMIKVTCGRETPADTFGQIMVTIDLVPTWQHTKNISVYAFRDETCIFDDISGDPLITNPNTGEKLNGDFDKVLPSVNLKVGESSTCGITRVSTERLEWSIIATYTNEPITGDNYKIFTVACVYQSSNSTAEVVKQGTIPANGANTEVVARTGLPMGLDRKYSLELVNANTNAVLGPLVPLGTPVAIRITGTGNDDGTATQAIPNDENGIRVERCWVENTKQTISISIVDDFCIDFSSGILFSGGVDITDRKGFFSNSLASVSPSFDMFALYGSNLASDSHLLHFKCDIIVCRVRANCDGDNCVDGTVEEIAPSDNLVVPFKRSVRRFEPDNKSPQAINMLERILPRKRREDEKTTAEFQIESIQYTVDIGTNMDALSTKNNIVNGQMGNNSDENSDANGLDQGTITLIIACVVVGVLLVLCFIAALLFCLRSRDKADP